MSETNAQVVARIAKSGGKILVVGGETSNLPDRIKNHAQIVIWDDNVQDFTNKEVPRNTRVILCSRWLSHTNKWRLDKAAKELRALKFPNLKAREIKEFLSEMIQEEPEVAPIEEKEVKQIVEQQQQLDEITIETNKEIKEIEQVAKTNLKRGVLKNFIVKYLDINKDYTVKGSITKEAVRLFDKAKQEGLKTTLASVSQGVSVTVKQLRGNKSAPAVKPTTKTSKTISSLGSFAELDRLIVEAITAMQLVQEKLTEIKAESEESQNMKKKLAEFLGL